MTEQMLVKIYEAVSAGLDARAGFVKINNEDPQGMKQFGDPEVRGSKRQHFEAMYAQVQENFGIPFKRTLMGLGVKERSLADKLIASIEEYTGEDPKTLRALQRIYLMLHKPESGEHLRQATLGVFEYLDLPEEYLQEAKALWPE